MNGTNLFKIALKALTNNKMRAFLTMLGIIIGVASVITMIAIGQGSKKSIQAQISEMGSNMIMIHPGGDRRGGVRRDPSEMQTLKLENYQTLRNEASFLSVMSISGVRFFRFSFSTILVISTVNTLAIIVPFSKSAAHGPRRLA